MSHKHVPQSGHGHAHKPSDPETDPIADYKEWTDNRYNPGYFTGGRLGPGIRWAQRTFSRWDRRVLFIVLILWLAAMVAIAFGTLL
jgi:hypothetical protein